ncbi:SGNH/GDSL hydrolase family protein [Clostridium sp. DJ247]|uniref:SGNH/GDSL hydrolase family protein n=1 Tax=Clostridium sp. DJ247 TaxID=2726188 RepID=UPI0016292A09|nr:SGNH/GDSL hydrolase family protein [Clostridium sp. DJ247]MBC2582624.1 SGNH/GDSL hydrolase family protein [Clostridium sp. DJ247]
MGERLLRIISAVAVSCVMLLVSSSKKINLSNNVKPPLKASEEQSPYKNYGYNIDVGLSKYKNALKNTSTQKVKIYCIGESNTRGEYSSDEVNNSWVGVMKSSLQNQYGNAGEGFISIYEGALPSGTKRRWTLGNGWSVSGASRDSISNVGGFGGCFGTSAKNTSFATLTFTGTDLDLLYAKATDGGTATVTIDGTEVGTISCLDEAVSFSHKVSYSGLSNTTHTLVITPDTTSSIFIEGAIASSNTTGIEVDKIAISSKTASYFNTTSTKKSWDALPEPDLVLLSFGINEAGRGVSVEDYKASMISLVTYWQGRGSNVCLVPNQKPADSWTTNWPAYVTSMYEIADTYNTGIIDIYKAYLKDYTVAQKMGLFGMAINDYSGGSGTNTAHPSDKGYKYIGDVIYNNLQ